MPHIVHVRKLTRHRIKDCRSLPTMKRVILQIAPKHHNAAVGQRDHAVAEHVPPERLGRNRVAAGIPYSRLKAVIRWYVTRTGHHKNFSIVKQTYVHRIDGHCCRQGLPLTMHVGLAARGRRYEKNKGARNSQMQCSNSKVPTTGCAPTAVGGESIPSSG